MLLIWLCTNEQSKFLARNSRSLTVACVIFVPGGATAAGWTLYAPLSIQMGMGMDLAIFAIHIWALIYYGQYQHSYDHIKHGPGMTLMKMPLFVWTWLITAYLLIAVMPVLAETITMILDRHFGTAFLMQLEVVTRNVPTYILVLWAP